VKVAGAARRPSALQPQAGGSARVCAIDARRFHPLDEAEEMYAHLRKHGFVVVREVADAEAIQKAKTLLWDYLEAHSWRVLEGTEGHVDRNDPNTWWCDNTWAPNAKDGIIYGRGVGQSEFMWHLRLLPRVRQAFAAVWGRVAEDDAQVACAAGATSQSQRKPSYALRSMVGSGEAESSPSSARYGLRSTQVGGKRRMDFAAMVGKRRRTDSCADSVGDDLLVSFDGAGVFRPWRGREQPTKGGWYHADQNYWNLGRQGFACVQGLVTLTDVHEGTGGLVLYPGSHHQFAKLSRLKRVKEEYEEKPEDYVRFHDKELQRVLGKRKIVPSLVRARAGDMILWDSRVVHSGTPGWYSGPAEKQPKRGCANPPAVGGRTFPKLAQEWRESANELLRVVGYVCMMPASRIPARRREHILDVRQRIFKRGWSTTHWPLEPALGAKEEKPKDELEPPANAVQRRLIGFR
jgi:hypothetical protein